MKYLFQILTILFFIVSCNTTSPEKLDEQAIIEILDSIQSNFNFDDLEGIMQFYHQDFLHNGDDFEWERDTIWFTRLNDFTNLNFEDIEIIINGDFATASFTMQIDDIITEEPSEENGDISYFFYDQLDWKICGKDFSQLP